MGNEELGVNHREKCYTTLESGSPVDLDVHFAIGE